MKVVTMFAFLLPSVLLLIGECNAIYSHFPKCTSFLSEKEKANGVDVPFVDVIPNAIDDPSLLLSIEESLSSHRVESEVYDGRFLSNVRVGKATVSKFRSLFGLLPASSTEYLPSVFITESTPHHVDCYYEWAGDSEEHGQCGQHITPDGRVGYVFLNDNPEAYFNHGDVNIPVKAGSFVHFRADIPHRTVINGGTVTLLGPLEVNTDSHVWGFDPDCGADELCCVPIPTTPDRRLNLKQESVQGLVPRRKRPTRGSKVKKTRKLQDDLEGCWHERGDASCFEGTNRADGTCTALRSRFDDECNSCSSKSKKSKKKGGDNIMEQECCSGVGESCESVTDCCYESCLFQQDDNGFSGVLAVTCTDDGECACQEICPHECDPGFQLNSATCACESVGYVRMLHEVDDEELQRKLYASTEGEERRRHLQELENNTSFDIGYCNNPRSKYFCQTVTNSECFDPVNDLPVQYHAESDAICHFDGFSHQPVLQNGNWANPKNSSGATLLAADPGIWTIENFLSENELGNLFELVDKYGHGLNLFGSCFGYDTSPHPKVNKVCMKISSETVCPGPYKECTYDTDPNDAILVQNILDKVNHVWSFAESSSPFIKFQMAMGGAPAVSYHSDYYPVTFLVYLHDGGASTIFPNIDVEIQPKKGMAAMFVNQYSNGRRNPKADHAVQAQPASAGNRLVMQFEFQASPQDLLLTS